MKRFLPLLIGLLLLLCAAVASILWHAGSFAERSSVTWDLSVSRSPSIVGWPTDATYSNQDSWASDNYPYKQITVALPGRPPIVSVNPANVYCDRVAGQLTVIQIAEDPVTCKQALDRLREISRVWGFSWDEQAYAAWFKRARAGDPSGISAGDEWNSPLAPRVYIGIKPAAGTPDRPWYLLWRISWLKIDREGS